MDIRNARKIAKAINNHVDIRNIYTGGDIYKAWLRLNKGPRTEDYQLARIIRTALNQAIDYPV